MEKALEQSNGIRIQGTFVDLLNIEVISIDDQRAVMRMEVVNSLLQPFGFLHGGATLSLLETAASMGSAHIADADEKVFGVHVDVRHRHSGLLGDSITGIATLEKEFPPTDQKLDRRTEIWKVVARNQEDVLISEGLVEMRIIKDL